MARRAERRRDAHHPLAAFLAPNQRRACAASPVREVHIEAAVRLADVGRPGLVHVRTLSVSGTVPEAFFPPATIRKLSLTPFSGGAGASTQGQAERGVPTQPRGPVRLRQRSNPHSSKSKGAEIAGLIGLMSQLRAKVCISRDTPPPRQASAASARDHSSAHSHAARTRTVTTLVSSNAGNVDDPRRPGNTEGDCCPAAARAAQHRRDRSEADGPCPTGSRLAFPATISVSRTSLSSR